MKMKAPVHTFSLIAAFAMSGAVSVTSNVLAKEPAPTAVTLTLAQAQLLIKAATEASMKLDAEVCIAVSDAGGTLLQFDRMDGAAPGCAGSAIAKAHSSAIYRAPTDVFMD